MSDRGIRRWALLGALASAALLIPACDRKWPEAGSDYEGLVNEGQSNETLPRSEQPATGGSGLQQQQQQDVDPRIGAPGYSEPRELPQTDQGVEMPPPDQHEGLGTTHRAGEQRGESPPSK